MTTAATPRFPTQVSELLRFRGPLVAAGAVVLAVGVLQTLTRFDDRWASAPRFLLAAVVTALVLGLAWIAPQQHDQPRVYASVLLVTGFPLLAVTLAELAELLGAGSLTGAGTLTWAGALLAVTYAGLARLRGSAICTLLGAAAGVVTLLAFVAWVFSPDGIGTYRWILLLALLALVAGALRLRDGERRHAVAIVDVAGLSTILLALLGTLDSIVGDAQDGGGSSSGGTGWELVLLVMGCGLVAYAAVDHEPGPAYLGAIVLLAFVVTSAGGDSLLGWPLVLVLVGGAAMAAGLRPTTPAPPSPDSGAPGAQTMSLPQRPEPPL